MGGGDYAEGDIVDQFTFTQQYYFVCCLKLALLFYFKMKTHILKVHTHTWKIKVLNWCFKSKHQSNE